MISNRARSFSASPAPLLSVEALSVRFASAERVVEAVRGLSFRVDRGETVALVGESGSGKSVSTLAVMRLVEHGGGRIVGGSMLFRRRDGTALDLARADAATMRGIRGADIAMIFQEPMMSLNPVFTVGQQIAESIRLHKGWAAPRPAPKRSGCSTSCASRTRAGRSIGIRTSSPVACASAS